jgi:hypothetical protein
MVLHWFLLCLNLLAFLSQIGLERGAVLPPYKNFF